MTRYTAEYPEWAKRFDRLKAQDLGEIEGHILALSLRPRFHLLVSTDGAKAEAVDTTLASLKAQLYREFEHRFVGEEDVATSNLDDWIILMRAGDALAPNALYWFACAILENPLASVVYSDDDAVDAQGRRHDPRFKPDWSPAHLRSTHYIGSAAALRGDAVAAAGGINAEDCRHGNYDLLLRITATSGANPVHVPAVLYHRQSSATSYKLQAASDQPPAASHADSAALGASYKLQATSYKLQAASYKLQATSYKLQAASYGAEEAWENPQWCMNKLREHLERIGSPAEVVPTLPGCWSVRYRPPERLPLISIIVPTRNAVALLRHCVDSVLRKTTYPRFEVLVIDNQSDDSATLSYFREIAANPAVRVLRYDHPFNYSAINNLGAREARGEILCLLNNDTEVIASDWLTDLAGHLLQKGVGAVGARLLYPDGRVQHAGVVLDPRYGADHLHAGHTRDDPGYCNRAMIAQESSAVTAACMLTWKRIYEDLRGLNEKDLPVAFNDVDYCLRLQEAGYRVVLDANVELFHHESATRGRENTLSKRLRAWRELRNLRKRWASRLERDPYYNPNLNRYRPHFTLAKVPRVRKPWR